MASVKPAMQCALGMWEIGSIHTKPALPFGEKTSKLEKLSDALISTKRLLVLDINAALRPQPSNAVLSQVFGMGRAAEKFNMLFASIDSR